MTTKEEAKKSSRAESGNYHRRSVERALTILAGFTHRRPEASLMDIAREQGLPKATAFQLLDCLEAASFVQRNAETGKYRLGVRVFELGSVYLAELRLDELARPFLEELSSRFGLAAQLAILDRNQMVCLALVEAGRPQRYYMNIGQRRLAHATSLGKCLLSELPDDRLQEVVRVQGLPRQGPRTATTLEELKERLAVVRAQGYAVDDEEGGPGFRCVGAPVRDHRGTVVAAVSVTGMTSEVTWDHIPIMAEALIGAALGISRSLGYRSAE